MFGISFAELAIIGLLILIVMGPEKLPEVAQWAGKGLRDLRRTSNTLRNALMIDEPQTRQRIEDSSRASAPAKDAASASKSPASPTPKAPPAKTDDPPGGQHPSYAHGGDATGGPALDQIDDAQFEAALQEQFRKQATTRTVAIEPARDTSSLRSVPIAVHRPSSALVVVSLSRHEVRS